MKWFKLHYAQASNGRNILVNFDHFVILWVAHFYAMSRYRYDISRAMAMAMRYKESCIIFLSRLQ